MQGDQQKRHHHVPEYSGKLKAFLFRLHPEY